MLLAAHSALVGYSAYVHSPTLNEPAHLVAGISHWRFGHFAVYNVNPPLVRMVAALPVMAVGCEEDWRGLGQDEGARPEWRLGMDLLAANSDRAFFLFILARWACIPFSVLGGIICFLWARELYGQAAGVVACTLWCFSPNIVGHASLITPDAHATALGLAACYAFWLWLKKPAWNAAFLAGIVLGIAELAKTTLVILFPLWPIVWGLYRILGRTQPRASGWLRDGAMLLTQLVMAIAILNLGYGCEHSFKKLGEFRFVSRLFVGEHGYQEDVALPISQHSHSSNRFAATWLGRVPVPVPGNYLAGLDVQRRDFEIYSRPSYLHGTFRHGTWWYYYLYGLTLKVPLGASLLLLLAAVMTLAETVFRRSPPDSWKDEIVLLVLPLAVLVLVSSQSGFNQHLRYAFPSLPFLYIFAGKVGRAFEAQRGLLIAIAVVGLTSSVASSLWSFPHSLSYFNTLAGGPRNGDEYLLGSNIDWGQDLMYLKSWVNRHPDTQPLYLAYFGRLNPSDANIDFSVPANGNTEESSFREILPGRYAVSVNLLRGCSWFVDDGKGEKLFVAGDALRHLRRIQPVATAGYSIRIYRVTFDEANRLRQELGLPELRPADLLKGPSDEEGQYGLGNAEQK